MQTSKDSSEILSELLTHLKISANKLAKEIGLSANTAIYHIKNGRNGISPDLAKKIIHRYPEISYNWLLTGEGSLQKEEEKDLGAKEEKHDYRVSSEEIVSIRRDIRAVNDNLMALTEGVKVNFERIAMGIDQGLKNDLKVIRFIEQINVKDITRTTDRLTKFFENK